MFTLSFAVLLAWLVACLTACFAVLFAPVLVDYLACFWLASVLLLLASCLPKGFAHFVAQWLAVFCLMSAWVSAHALYHLDQRLDESLEKQVIVVEGQVLGLPRVEGGEAGQGPRKERFDFRIEAIHHCPQSVVSTCSDTGQVQRNLPLRWLSSALSDAVWLWFFPKALPDKVNLSLYHSLDSGPVKGGQYHRFQVKLSRPRGSVNFSGFDYESWLFAQGVHGRGYIRRADSQYLPEQQKASLSAWRQKIFDALQEQAGERARGGAFSLLLALSLGERGLITEETREQLRRTGTSHLLAISGMHIGMFSGLLCFLLLWCMRVLQWLVQLRGYTLGFLATQPQAMMTIAVGLSLLASLVYALLAGFSLPTQRALIMVFCYGLALLRYQRTDFYSVWLLSLLLVLLFDPKAVLSAGLYLSFAAVLLIQWFLLGRAQWHESYSAFRRHIINMVKAQWVVLCGLLPLSLLLFSSFFMQAFVANLLAIPAVAFVILPLCLLATCLAVLAPDLASWSLALSLDLLDALLAMLAMISESALAVLEVNLVLNTLTAALLFLWVLLCFMPLPWRMKLLAWPLPLLAIFVLWQVQQQRLVPMDEFRLQMLDVGQGLSVLVETRQHRLLYDTGAAFGSSFDAGELMALPALQASEGFVARPLDLLVLSHGDQDHIGGARSVLAQYPVSAVLGYERATQQKASARIDTMVPWQVCAQGQRWRWDGVLFELLSPASIAHASGEKSNNLSCVLKINSATMSVLIPGDIEEAVESRLLADASVAALLDADVLLAPHHGSKSSSHEAFLQAVSPTLMLVSAGFRNQFGHPHGDVIERSERLGIRVLNSAESGAVMLQSWQWSSVNWQDSLRLAREETKRLWRFGH